MQIKKLSARLDFLNNLIKKPFVTKIKVTMLLYYKPLALRLTQSRLTMMAGLCHFVFSPRNDATRKDEKTPYKKRKDAMRKVEKLPLEKTKFQREKTKNAMRKDAI